MTQPLHPVGPDRFRAVMGHFATGVTVVTATSPEGPVGMTANAVCSLSLDPLLLLVCFGVNVLAAGQEELARLFASKAPEHAKFAGVAHRVDEGIPVIDGALAWVGCRLERLVPGGDHTIGIGAVEAAESGGGDPLLYYRGAYRA
jgi:flavin reductase (DIM6/NTAB) family NADH-FMN oxidoreductase RutF